MRLTDDVMIAWAIFLVVAYVLTLAVLPILFGVIRAANRIARDSARTLPAAVGILNNVKSIGELKTTQSVGTEILNTAGAIVNGAASIESELAKARNLL